MKTCIITFFVALLTIQHSHGVDKRIKKAKEGCAKKDNEWKLVSLIFYPKKSRVQTETLVMREVRIPRNSNGQSTAEMIVKDMFKGYSRYAYHNGTVIYKPIKDAGQVPRIIDGKVTQELTYEAGGYLYAKNDFEKDISSKFACSSSDSSPSSSIISCKVVLNQNRYQVPFAAMLQPLTGGYVCTSYGLWEKVDDPVLELVTETMKPT